MGVLAGSVTLTGGPATGLAFAPLFEQAGVTGAATLAVSAAMVGIVAGGLIGGPIGTYLLNRQPRCDARSGRRRHARASCRAASARSRRRRRPPARTSRRTGCSSTSCVIMIGRWAPVCGSAPDCRRIGWTLPAYIGAMIVAAVIRNLDDATGLIGMSQRTIDDLGTVALALFLVMALMTLGCGSSPAS